MIKWWQVMDEVEKAVLETHHLGFTEGCASMRGDCQPRPPEGSRLKLSRPWLPPGSTMAKYLAGRYDVPF
jgi:hypothetical protein